MKIRVGGIAMTILNEMPAALSNRLVRRNWFMNGLQTWCRDTSSKPGKKVLRLPRIIVFTGADVTKRRLYLVLLPIIGWPVHVSPPTPYMPAGTALLLPNARCSRD